jgi:hypothetical protein
MPVKLLTDFNAFVSASAAGGFVGWGIVYLSSRIERRRQERHAERYGEYGTAPIEPSAWVRFMNSRRFSNRPKVDGAVLR